MPFGSERSHFTHSPHLRSALIPLIPPEIQARMGKESEVQKATELGFVYICFPRDTPPQQGQGFWPFHQAAGIQSSCHMEMVKQRLQGALHRNPPRLEPEKYGVGRGGWEKGLQLTLAAVRMQQGLRGGRSIRRGHSGVGLPWHHHGSCRFPFNVPYGCMFTYDVNCVPWVMYISDIPLAGFYVCNMKASLPREGTWFCHVSRVTD